MPFARSGGPKETVLTSMRNVWDGLDPRRRLVAVLSVVAILAAVFGISRMAAAPPMALLYSGLDPAAAGEVVAALEAEGVAFEVRDAAILVARPERDRIRMELASRGLPSGGPAGYEILDSLSGFGTTSQMFDAAYWRAKEGELARTITGSPNVRSARVHLANPVAQPFARAPEGSASVTVTMSQGTLATSQAEAIRYLVSSSVAGIAPESVAVIDSAAGVVLAGAEDDLTKAGVQNPNDRAQTLRANIERLLEARVGPGRAIVEVNVDAEMDSETITERVIDPDSRVAISSETESSQENAQGSAPGVTVASNLPDGDVEAGAAGSNRSATQSRERQNFEVSETRRERVVLPGQVRRISVAVMVDGITTPAADGTATWAPRPDEEMQTLRQLVESAIGFNAERGDTVTIESLQFTLPPEQGALVEAGGAGFLEAQGGRMAQLGVLGAIVLALIVFVLRPMLARRPAAALGELTGPRELGHEPRPLAGSIPAGDILDLAPQTVTKIDRLREVITSRGDESAAVLRSWIEAPEARKESAGT
jgi:flagellar M-ring protein FliF